MNKHLRNRTSLSAAVLGAMTAFAVGCADTTAEEENLGEQEAAITSRGITVSGCSASAIFDIVSNSTNNQTFNFLAIDDSAMQNLQTQLYTLNENNQLEAIQEEAVQASESLQQMFNSLTNYQNAHQRSLAQQHQDIRQIASTTTSVVQTHRDSMDTLSDSISSQSRQVSGSSVSSQNAFNTAWGENLAANTSRSSSRSASWNAANASQSAFQANASFIANTAVGGFAGFGLVGVGPATFLSNVASNVAASATNASQSSFAAQSAMADNAVVNLARSGFLTSARTSSHQAQNYFDSAASSTRNTVRTSEQNYTSSATTASTLDSLRSSTDSLQASEANQASAQLAQNASQAAQSAQSRRAIAFQNLSRFKSNHLVLQMSWNANSQKQITTLFAGNDAFTVHQDFLTSFPNCVVAASVTPPAKNIIPPKKGVGVMAPSPVVEVGPAIVERRH